MHTIAEMLELARGHLAGDRPAEAEQVCRQVLDGDHESAEAHYLLGAAQLQAGQVAEAAARLQHAVQLAPNYAAARHHWGVALAQLGQLDQAAAQIEYAVRLQPGNAEFSKNLARVRAARDRASGLDAAARGKRDVAVNYFRTALVLLPDDVETLSCLGATLAELKQTTEALACWRRVTELRPDSAEAFYNLGIRLVQAKCLDEAIAAYRRAVELKPHFPTAHNNLAVVLFRQERFREAEQNYLEALRCDPDYAEAHLNRAATLAALDRLDEAETSCRRAIDLKSDYLGAYDRLGDTLLDRGEPAKAAGCYRQCLAQTPDYDNAHLGLAISLLIEGHWQDGWPEYEWRPQGRSYLDYAPTPRWDGLPLAGRSILLRAEQGHGDTLQFIRYTALVKEQGGHVIVESQPALVRLLAHCDGVDQVISPDSPWPPCDTFAQLPALPGIFRSTPETVPAAVPYLLADASLVTQWKTELAAEPGLKIGIAWQGNREHPKDCLRSFPLAMFAGIARRPDVRLVVLQFGDGREQLAEVARDWRLFDPAERLADFENTAALVSNLDLVITCDSAPAHLAGGLGVPTWLALAFAPDWRWLLERNDTPWYPTMRLFRQPKRRDWPGAFRAIEQALDELIKATR